VPSTNQNQFEIPPEGKKIPIIIIKVEVKSATTQVYVLYFDLSMALLCFASGLTSRAKIKENLAGFWVRMVLRLDRLWLYLQAPRKAEFYIPLDL